MKSVTFSLILAVMGTNLSFAQATPEDFAAAARLGKPLAICKKKSDAQACNASCRSLAPMSLNISVDPSDSHIIKHVYRSDTQIQDIDLRRCTVTDVDNWTCSNSAETPNYVESMTNGKYFYMMEIEQGSFYMCTK